MIGQSFGSYRAVRLVGRGGMGVVYAAEHPLLGSQAVVKQLRPELSAQRDVIERFFNEARAASRIKHPGIVSVFDFGYAADGTAYFVMEFLEGESLAARLARVGRIPEAHAVRLARQIASALAAAHEAGIVHRDLKPDNVFVVPDEAVAGGERAKVLDFGIAKLGGESGEGIAVTRTGALLGSPLYMSPEQCRGTGEVDFRADVYALGCLLYAMTTGRPPFVGEGVGEIIGKHIYEQPPRPRELAPELSAGLESVMLQALEKEASRRQPSMRGFAAALEQLGGGESAAPPVQVSIPGGAAVGPVATADTVLSTSPPFTGSREVTPLEAAATLGGGTEPMMQVAPAPARQRTVAMWIAAALAAGMAGFFVVARVDERGADRPPPSRSTSGPSGAAPDREGLQVDPGSSAGMGSGGGGTPVPGIASHADHAIAPPEPLPDAGVGLAVETAEELDAGAKNAKKKIVKKVKRPGPKNVTEPLPDEQPRQAPIQQENAPIQQRNVDPSEREATVE